MNVSLRLLDKADKEILKLPRAVKGAIYDFQRKFREDPDSPGLQFKQLAGNSRLYSARVTADYRALLLRVTGTEYLLVAVKPRGSAYENLDRYNFGVNPVSGGIEFIDVADTEQRSAELQGAGPALLFALYPAEQLRELGVVESLLPLIAKITTEEELLGLAEHAPSLTTEVLFALHDGRSPDEVLEQVTAPVRPEEQVDVTDYEAALTRPATLVTTDDAALQAALEGDFARWQVFLHPAQRKIVEKSYNGPARVSGGPGTGKTIVALHRVKRLADRLPPAATDHKDILFTTFNKNLAADLRSRLLELAGRDVLERVDVINIDALAAKVVTEAEPGARRHWIDESKAVEVWEALLLELGETSWDPRFLNDEWSQVVLGHALYSRDEYFRARRAGRGRTLNRVQRAAVWQLVEQFTKRLREQNLWTFRQIAAEAAGLERIRAKRGDYRYKHVVVDEAQDLSPAHWMLLRTMVAPGPNDLFLAGDTHQRIYDSYVSLSSLGIAIRGRSARLTLSYRSTREILASAERMLGSERWDDLDGGTDTLAGYRSVLHGPRPAVHGYPTWAAELASIVRQVQEWLPTDGTTPSIGVAVPSRRMMSEVESYLTDHGVAATSIGPDGPRKSDAVHIGTLHRFKGLEYQRMVVAGVSDGVFPDARIAGYRESDPVRYEREIKQARSLLFVAATRARDALTISWHGQPSPFLPGAPSR